ncbi:hypothetical protein DERF_014532 [Dermatophagoides farinae]|uniref:Mannosyltransferase n=1 Tax=Dermatophagoides farinae TaxID=6954 RepID=A0A922HIH0_DERFA|nr:hypothetical protein DERF_014532 [Dermatophagoides farinae]
MKISRLKLLLYFLQILRIVIVFIPQSGYIQPDEFHQFTEPLAERFLRVETLKCWEFTRDQPIRSMIIPQLLIGPMFLAFHRMFSPTSYQSLSSYWILVLPRFIMVLFSFITDIVLKRLVTMINNNSDGHRSLSSSSRTKLYTSLIHSSTYLAFTYYNRTFTNTIETILMALLLLIIFESLQLKRQKYTASSTKIGSILAIGFFNRPTFVIFASVPVIFWICSFSRKQTTTTTTTKTTAKHRIWSIITKWIRNSFAILQSFLVVSLMFIVGDSIFYNRFDLMTIINDPYDMIQNLVITPWNFIQYNIRPSNLANHGLHPVYFHSLVSMPLMFTLLAVMIYMNLFHNMWKFFRRSSSRRQCLVQIINDFYYGENQFRFRCTLHLTIFRIIIIAIIDTTS